MCKIDWQPPENEAIVHVLCLNVPVVDLTDWDHLSSVELVVAQSLSPVTHCEDIVLILSECVCVCVV